jgi:hypothetical protein
MSQFTNRFNVVLAAAALALALPAAHADVSFANTRLMTQKDARHIQSRKGTLSLVSATKSLSFEAEGNATVVVPFDQIQSMRLDETVSRIHAPFTGRVDHEEFLTLIYTDAAGKPEYSVFRLNGRTYRETVAALEAETGKPVTQRSL